MPPILNIIALVSFAASLSLRGLDPVMPQVASSFDITIAKAASLSAVTAFAFAIVQPVLGAAADMFGKARTMIVCMIVLALANALGASATSFEMLFAARVLTGLACGGLFPVAVSLTGDLVPPEQRQVAISRVIAGSMTGTLLGASAAGVIAEFFDWRGVILVLGALAFLSAVAVTAGFGVKVLRQPTAKVDIAGLMRGYREIFSNPNAPVIYVAVFIEGSCLIGLFPYVTSFLFDLGMTSLSLGGVVMSGFAIGGLIYTLTVSKLLSRFRITHLMMTGGVLLALQVLAIAAGPSWPIQTLVMVMIGWSFYLLHGALQVYSTELSVEARASAVSLQNCFFFFGQAAGPVAYGAGLQYVGKLPTLAFAACVLAVLGFVCAKLLKPVGGTGKV